jgi:hypothetical protein
MAEPKTKQTTASVGDFIDRVPDESRRKDCRALIKIMRQATGVPPKMWGPSIVGFGTYHYKYASGREGDSPLVGFSPRKQDLTLYIMPGFDRYPELMTKLGKHKTGKVCLYIKRLADVDMDVLQKLVETSVKHTKRAAK